jgi:hypothetical protein
MVYATIIEYGHEGPGLHIKLNGEFFVLLTDISILFCESWTIYSHSDIF